MYIQLSDDSIRTWRTSRLFCLYASIARHAAERELEAEDTALFARIGTEFMSRSRASNLAFYRSLSDNYLQNLFGNRILGLPSY